MTYAQVDLASKSLARAIENLRLGNTIQADGRSWKLVGIWSPNRWEWLATHISNMYFKRTTVSFFETMSTLMVKRILDETKISVIFCSAPLIAKIVTLRLKGELRHLKVAVSFDKHDAYD